MDSQTGENLSHSSLFLPSKEAVPQRHGAGTLQSSLHFPQLWLRSAVAVQAVGDPDYGPLLSDINTTSGIKDVRVTGRVR